MFHNRRSLSTHSLLPLLPTGRKLAFTHQLKRAVRLVTPFIVAFSFATVGHAQGTMDFSGAQTLMTTFKIIAQAPASLDGPQLRLCVQLLLSLSPYGLFEEVAEHFSKEDPDHSKTDDELLNEALASCEDDKLMGFVLRLLLTEHVATPLGEQPDWLMTAERLFVPVQEKPAATPKKRQSGKARIVNVSKPTKRKAA